MAGGALAALGQAASAQILVGQTAGFTGPVGAGVKETTDVARLYINAVNARGGVNGQKIKLVSLDGKFDHKLATENAKKLIEEQNVFAMFLTRAPPPYRGHHPAARQEWCAAGGAIDRCHGAAPAGQKKHIFNVRTTHQHEAEKVVPHLNSMGITRIGMVYADDSFGSDGVAGAQKSLMTAKLQPAVLEKFDRSKPDFGPIAPKVAQANTQALIMVASAQAVVDGVKAFRAAGSHGADRHTVQQCLGRLCQKPG